MDIKHLEAKKDELQQGVQRLSAQVNELSEKMAFTQRSLDNLLGALALVNEFIQEEGKDVETKPKNLDLVNNQKDQAPTA